MSDAEIKGLAPQEVVVRVVVEQQGGSVGKENAPSDTTLSDLARAVLRLAEVTESLAVVDAHDAEIVKRIETFDERIKSLSERVGALEEALQTSADMPSEVSPAATSFDLIVLEAMERRLEERLAALMEDALTRAAFRATSSTDRPPVTAEPEPAPAADLKVTKATLITDGEAGEPGPVTAPAPAAGDGERQLQADETPDYMVTDERLERRSANAARAERIVLFFLSQPNHRHDSPKNTAGKDVRLILDMESSDWGNTLAYLQDIGVLWTKKKNTRRTRMIGLDGEALKERHKDIFYTQRLKEKIEQTEFNKNRPEETAPKDEEETDLDTHQKDILMVIGEEEEAALIVEDLVGIMVDRFGGTRLHYALAIDELIEKGLIHKHKYGALEEYTLLPSGRISYESIVASDAEGDAPPFLVRTQAS